MLRTSLAAAVLLAVTACQSSPPVAGTWKVAPGQAATRVPVAVMTLAGDGTFTAQANYGGRSQVMSGFYTFRDGEIVFDTEHGTRSYPAMRDGDELVVSHEGTDVRMVRMKK